MGYFPNGTSGESYYEEWCERCIHEEDPKGHGCPVWFLHNLHNYDECNKPDSYLHVLIPRNEKGWNDRCTMFVERAAAREEPKPR